MSKIIAVANQKGGTGKTTTAVHLAYYLAVEKNQSTLLIDADSQNSSSQWLYNLQTLISYQAINDKNQLFEQIPELAEKYEYIIVDGPAGSLEGENKAIMARCDVAIVPIQPKVLDLSSTLKAVMLINQAQDSREGLPQGAIFLNRAKPRTRLKDEATRFLKTIPGILALKTVIHDREVISDAPGQNATVWTMKTKAAITSRTEYNQLFQEIFGLPGLS